MEKPRPSPNFGKFTSTRATPDRRAATEPGSSVGSRRSTSPCSGDGAFSVTTRRCLISAAIDLFLNGFDADAMHHVDEALDFAVAALEVALDEFFDHQGNVGAGERRADHFAERRARRSLARPRFS